jgi:antitoxin HicB
MSTSRTYSIVLEPMPEGGFMVHVPALPEIVTGCDNEVEALAMAKDAIKMVLASRAERGEAIPNDVAPLQVHALTVSLAA